MDTKHCRVCGLDKPLDEMVKRKASVDGHDNICKVCDNERSKKWRQENAEKVISARKVWYENNAEAKRAASKQWKQDNPERARETTKKWRQKNAEHVREVTRQRNQANPERRRNNVQRWRLVNPEKDRAAKQRWRESHPERTYETAKTWRAANAEHHRSLKSEWEAANPEVRRAINHRRRARIKGNGGSFTAAEWLALKAKYNYRCLACGASEPEIKLVPDHIRPIAKEGLNVIDNVQPLCTLCNAKKGTKIIDYRPEADRK